MNNHNDFITIRRTITLRSFEQVVSERYENVLACLSGDPCPVYLVEGGGILDTTTSVAVVKYIPDFQKGLLEAQFATKYSGSVGPLVFSAIANPDILEEGVEIVMDHAFGSLTEAREKGVSFTESKVLRNLAYAVAELAYVMETDGNSHCDLKPENVLLYFTPTGDSYYRLADFGLSRPIYEARRIMREQPRFYGTSGYISPEFLHESCKSTHSNPDIFSYGMLLYWATVGSLPDEFGFDETHSSKERYVNLMRSGEYRKILQQGLHSSLDDVITPLISECTDYSHARIRSFADILNYLKEYDINS